MPIADWLPYPPPLYINVGFGLSGLHSHTMNIIDFVMQVKKRPISVAPLKITFTARAVSSPFLPVFNPAGDIIDVISVKYMFLYIGHYKNFTYIGSI